MHSIPGSQGFKEYLKKKGERDRKKRKDNIRMRLLYHLFIKT